MGQRTRTLLLYVTLVGIPLLGLVGILRVGERLAAPASVGGNWQIEVEAASVDNVACGHLTLLADPPTVNISQSGTHLVLAFNDQARTILTGALTQTTIVAATGSAGWFRLDKPEQTELDLRLEATVDDLRRPQHWLGHMTSRDCREPVLLTATRQDTPSGD